MTHPLHLCLPEIETFDSAKEEFGVFGGFEIDLEYSLYTISLWESKWKKSFIKNADKLTVEERLSLYELMCITPNVTKAMLGLLTPQLEKEIFQYMADPMSATVINRVGNQQGGKNETVTTELIYYWMSSLNIPYSCDRWHFNRLLKLIEVGFIKQAGPGKKKMSRREAIMYQKQLNDQRKAMYNTKG